MLKNKLLLSAILLSLFALCADAAAPAPRRGSAQPAAGGQQGVRGGTPATATNQQSGAQQSSGAAAPASARAGVRQTQAAPAAGASGGAKPVAARSGTTPAGAGGVKPAAGGGNVGGAGKPIAARSGTMNSVVQKGPSVQQAASSAGLVNEECKNKWNGCMDMFCILGNENGMRCSCSDQRKNLDSIMNDIDDLDNKIRQYGSSALEKVNLSDDQRAYIDAQMAKANADMSIDPNAPASQPGAATKKRPSLNQNAFANLSSEITFDAPQEEIIMDGEDLSKFSGDQLKVKAVDLCRKQMPAECRNDMQMLQTMYSQGIASDCKAFEVELNARKKKATENYQVVQAAVREAALDKYEEQNKWDLGQCVVEFGKCMKTEDTCGSEWQRCATDLYDQEELGGGAGKGNKTATKDVGGITLSGATMFRLESSKVICEGVLNSCVRVKDQVWDRFLTNVAPDLRSAEISSEANTRVSCLTDIAECVRDACMSKFDPKQQEADMNACLTDRNNARQFCALGKPGKLGINKCESALGQGLWGYLDAKLASMRIDACTEAVKGALQEESVCGKGYLSCVGMTVEQVLYMLMPDANEVAGGAGRGQNDTKLIACRDAGTYGNNNYSTAGASIEKVRPIIQSVLMSMVSAQQEVCEKAVQEKFTAVCRPSTPTPPEGATADTSDTPPAEAADRSQGVPMDCDSKFSENTEIGKSSLSIPVLTNGGVMVAGLIQYDKLDTAEFVLTEKRSLNAVRADKATDAQKKGARVYNIDADKYIKDATDAMPLVGNGAPTGSAVQQQIRDDLNKIQRAANAVIDDIILDPAVSNCVLGKDLTNIGGKNAGNEAAFPNLLLPYSSLIMKAALAQAAKNYDAQFQEKMQEASRGVSEKMANFMCMQKVEGGSLESNAPSQTRLAIYTPSNVPANMLKTQSKKLRNVFLGYDQTTWGGSNRQCTLNRTMRWCYNYRYSPYLWWPFCYYWPLSTQTFRM